MAFAAEARALHWGALPHPGLVCLFSSRSRASMSRSVPIKCQHGDRDRDSRQPECLQTHRMDPNLTTSENMIKKRGGKMREERLNRGGGRSGEATRRHAEEPSPQTRKATRQQWDDEDRNRGKKGIKEERGARSGALQK